MDWNPCAYKIRIWIWNYLTYKLVKRGFVCLMLMFETKFLVVDCFCVRKMCNFPSRVFFYVSLVVTISFIQRVKKIMHCTYYSAVWNRCFCCLQELPLCYKHPLHTFHQLSHGKIMVWYMYLCSLVCPVWFFCHGTISVVLNVRLSKVYHFKAAEIFCISSHGEKVDVVSYTMVTIFPETFPL